MFFFSSFLSASALLLLFHRFFFSQSLDFLEAHCEKLNGIISFHMPVQSLALKQHWEHLKVSCILLNSYIIIKLSSFLSYSSTLSLFVTHPVTEFSCPCQLPHPPVIPGHSLGIGRGRRPFQPACSSHCFWILRIVSYEPAHLGTCQLGQREPVGLKQY